MAPPTARKGGFAGNVANRIASRKPSLDDCSGMLGDSALAAVGAANAQLPTKSAFLSSATATPLFIAHIPT